MQRRNNTKNNQLTKEDIRRYNHMFWKIILGCLAFGFLFIFCIRIGVFGKLPSFKELEKPKSNLSSEVISSDGKVLGTYFVQNQYNLTYEDIYHNLLNYLI